MIRLIRIRISQNIRFTPHTRPSGPSGGFGPDHPTTENNAVTTAAEADKLKTPSGIPSTQNQVERSMKLPQSMARLLWMPLLALIAALTLVQAQPAQEYKPRVGQEGKDVIWVPTRQELVDKMLDLAKVTPNDYVIDLGSGDGRTVITAAKRGAKALGIEYNPDMVELSKRNAAQEGVADKATFVQGDIFESDFSQATVITLFLLPNLNLRLRPKILDMKPGVRVVSNTFDMGDWAPDERATLPDCSHHCTALLWIVPAKVQGTWKMPNGEIVLQQKYQMLNGSVRIGNTTTPISNGKITGDLIEFSAGTARFTGRVGGNAIEGTIKSATGESKWQAMRAN
ncbi:MAG TPA: class I SAM-dependent methyltransferase [Xanthobacteraceae bacterium]|nr:class I SAM-dependent methyltransferase [Xanthobacteraceae bacterium]